MADVDLIQAILQTVCDDVYVAIRDHDYGDYQKNDGSFGWVKSEEAAEMRINLSTCIKPHRPDSQQDRKTPEIYIYQGELFTDDTVESLNEDGWAFNVHLDLSEMQKKGSLPSTAVIQKALVINNPRRKRREHLEDDPAGFNTGGIRSDDEFGLVSDVGSFRLDSPDPYDEWRRQAEEGVPVVDPGIASPLATIITIQLLFITSRIEDESARNAGIHIGLYASSLDD